MKNLIVSASPHIVKKGNSTRRIMIDVLIALVPALIAAVIFYGYMVIINAVVCMATCFGFELLYGLVYKNDFSKEEVKRSTAWDCSCLVTGLLIALNIPTCLNIWGLNIKSGESVIISFDTVIACIIASAVAIVIIKQLFGGIGKNFMNPALGARVFLFLCFASAFSPVASAFDASTSATWLAGKESVSGAMLLDMFLGNIGSGAVGEACFIAIMLGYAYLVLRGVIDWKLPLVILGGVAVFALVFDGAVNGRSGADLWLNMLAHVLSGGIAFGAVFMATDYATSPNTDLGRIIYGIGIALITMLIRCFASYPEGVSFAILIMNAFTPLIDKGIRPKPFGFIKSKKEGK